MSASPASPELPDMEAMHVIAGRFETAQKVDPALHQAELNEVLRYVKDKRAIAQGQFDGQPAIFRIHLHKPENALREWNELSRVWPVMQTGNHRVTRPLHVCPNQGLLVVEQLSGTPLLSYLYQLEDQAERLPWFDQAAQWLRRYTEVSEGQTDATPEGWLGRATRASGTQPFNRLRKLEKPILKELRRIAEGLNGTQWRNAICHGDFHPNNLICDGTRLMGFDCGGSARFPIYKDMARFLMHMGRRGMTPSGERSFGVDAVGFDAFATTFDLSDQDRALTLPFFLGVEALLRVETRKLSNSRIRRAKLMYEALLEDLKLAGR